jgi:GNAT superfamily N-acetyltransferase
MVAAFVDDPVVRHLFPDEDTYPQYAAAFFGHLFDKRVCHGTVWTIERGASAAMWDGPSAEPGPPGGLDELPADVRARVTAYDDALHAVLPRTPFWYLGVLGTHPDYAGRRWGRAVMAVGLRRAATDGLPAVLETSNPANIEVYRRAGWTVIRDLTHHGVNVWVMHQPVGE